MLVYSTELPDTLFFFFFQAEDGIRDLTVTGVQTCALPISYNYLFKACQANCTTTLTPSNNAFDFVIGGGLDIPVSHNVSIRPAQFDFVLTRFGNDFTKGNQNQSNFRYNGGIVFRW